MEDSGDEGRNIIDAVDKFDRRTTAELLAQEYYATRETMAVEATSEEDVDDLSKKVKELAERVDLNDPQSEHDYRFIYKELARLNQSKVMVSFAVAEFAKVRSEIEALNETTPGEHIFKDFEEIARRQNEISANLDTQMEVDERE